MTKPRLLATLTSPPSLEARRIFAAKVENAMPAHKLCSRRPTVWTNPLWSRNRNLSLKTSAQRTCAAQASGSRTSAMTRAVAPLVRGQAAATAQLCQEVHWAAASHGSDAHAPGPTWIVAALWAPARVARWERWVRWARWVWEELMTKPRLLATLTSPPSLEARRIFAARVENAMLAHKHCSRRPTVWTNPLWSRNRNLSLKTSAQRTCAAQASGSRTSAMTR